MVVRKRCKDADDGSNARTGMLAMGELSRSRQVDVMWKEERGRMRGGVGASYVIIRGSVCCEAASQSAWPQTACLFRDQAKTGPGIGNLGIRVREESSAGSRAGNRTKGW